MLEPRSLLVVCACAASLSAARGWGAEFPLGADRATWGPNTGCATATKGSGILPSSVRVESETAVPAGTRVFLVQIPSPCPESQEGFMLTACDSTPPLVSVMNSATGLVIRQGELSRPARVHVASYCKNQPVGPLYLDQLGNGPLGAALY